MDRGVAEDGRPGGSPAGRHESYEPCASRGEGRAVRGTGHSHAQQIYACQAWCAGRRWDAPRASAWTIAWSLTKPWWKPWGHRARPVSTAVAGSPRSTASTSWARGAERREQPYLGAGETAAHCQSHGLDRPAFSSPASFSALAQTSLSNDRKVLRRVGYWSRSHMHCYTV